MTCLHDCRLCRHAFFMPSVLPASVNFYGAFGCTSCPLLQRRPPQVTSVLMDEGSGQLFTGSFDGTVRVWSCTTGEVRRCMRRAVLVCGQGAGAELAGDWWAAHYLLACCLQHVHACHAWFCHPSLP